MSSFCNMAQNVPYLLLSAYYCFWCSDDDDGGGGGGGIGDDDDEGDDSISQPLTYHHYMMIKTISITFNNFKLFSKSKNDPPAISCDTNSFLLYLV